MQLPKVKSVTAISNCRLSITFSNATQGEYDVSHLAGKGVFGSWETDHTFFEVFINPDSGAISWPGKLDIDTINAYCEIKGIDADQYYLTKNSS